MATFDQIKEVRLQIADPPGFIDFLEVANFAALPVTPVAQTGYKAVDTSTYYGHNGTAWTALELMVSDGRISAWIDSLGIPGAVRKSIEAIVAQLPSQLQIVENQSGAESVKFTSLLDRQKFYEKWLEALTPPDTSVNTGKYFKTEPACIAGGNL